MQKHLVIIGGVAAGTKAAAKARREDPDLQISIYTDGQYISYSACGLPYYIEDIVKDHNRLLVRLPEVFEKENIHVFVKHSVTEINPDKKSIKVKNLETGEMLEVEYSKLLIATGAHPFVPNLEGINLKNIFTLRSVEDGIAIKNKVHSSKKALVVGAGLIGMEVTEAFVERGLETTIVELAAQILPALDKDMADVVQKYLEEEKGIKVITGEAIKKFIGNKNGEVVQAETTSGKLMDTDLVILSIGVRPNVEIAKACGVETGETGAIKVNKKMKTNVPDIYSAGDCAEKTHMVSEKSVWIPLGSTANKEGRVAAVNITGGDEVFKGILGSAVTKIFDFTVARTGLDEKELQKLGYSYETVTISNRDRAGYLPGSEKITIKVIGEKETRRLLGAQIVGKGDADKRINVIASALNSNLKVDDLADLDLTYAPPYSPAIDPLLTAVSLLQEKL